MRLVIDFQRSRGEIDSSAELQRDGKSKKKRSTRDFDPNWRYTIASSILVIAIAIPQISDWVESQLLVKSLQSLVALPSATVTTTTGSYSLSNGQIAFPTAKDTPITSEFGWRQHPITGNRKFHTGIDFGADLGTPIYAIANGRVEYAGDKGGYGNTVIINHGSGKSTLYGHASKIYVRKGQQVVRGQMIAAVGSTGMSTGPHLHFEVRVNDKPVDPHPYLQQYLAGR
jgi:murein DD-endopeptidase MepM/ murein hydrolase activator NlpD